MKNKIRVRFAPSPTGIMHLGNVRAALMNYLFARQKNGTFVLRMEDTDTQRNVVEAEKKIIIHLKWLGLGYDEGPLAGGEYGPYFQTERTQLYAEKLTELAGHNKAYRCFCSKERLDTMRERQRAAGQPPRYDRTCALISEDKIQRKLDAKLPYIWRVKVNEHQILDIKDLAKGTISFEMKNFSDFAITRQDGSFTFIFTNFVDDWLMEISHVIRGEDHLSNTALQAALYDAFMLKLPTFWHLPIICNQNGEKLSKRDFGFTLHDLQNAGFLPQAIVNYLTIIGGSFEKEIQSVHDFAQTFNFEKIPSSSSIKYDLEKLTWINHQWVSKLADHELIASVMPYVHEAHPESVTLNQEKLNELIIAIKPEIKTLVEVKQLLAFYFQDPRFDANLFKSTMGDNAEKILDLIRSELHSVEKPEEFLKELKAKIKASDLKMKEVLSSVRYILAETFSGIGMNDLFKLLEPEKIRKRLQKALN